MLACRLCRTSGLTAPKMLTRNALDPVASSSDVRARCADFRASSRAKSAAVLALTAFCIAVRVLPRAKSAALFSSTALCIAMRVPPCAMASLRCAFVSRLSALAIERNAATIVNEMTKVDTAIVVETRGFRRDQRAARSMRPTRRDRIGSSLANRRSSSASSLAV